MNKFDKTSKQFYKTVIDIMLDYDVQTIREDYCLMGCPDNGKGYDLKHCKECDRAFYYELARKRLET